MPYSALPGKTPPAYLNLTDYDAIKGNFEVGVPDLFTTKGDMVAATGADAGARLAVGADDAVLVADSSQTTGLAWQIQPAARVRNSGNLALSAGVWTTLTFDTERYDTDAVHSTSANTGRLTAPSGGAGLYLIGACAQFDTSAIGVGVDVAVRILLNGTTVIAQDSRGGAFGASYDTTVVINTLYALSATDYVELQAYTTQACNVNAAANYSPEFWMQWQRRQ